MKNNKNTKNFRKTIIKKYVEKDINVDRLKDILNEQIRVDMEKFTEFAIMFCWKVIIIEYNISIVKEEVPDWKSNQESLHSVIKRVFNQIKINNFEEFTLIFVWDIKKLTYRYYVKQPMQTIERKMMRRFFEGKDMGFRCWYRWLPDCILHRKLECICRFRAPYSFRMHYLESPIM